MSFSRKMNLSIFSMYCFVISCATVQQTAEQEQDREWSKDSTIESLVESPINHAWVQVTGWLEGPPYLGEIELYATSEGEGLADTIEAIDVPVIGIRESELSADLPEAYGGKKVVVTGRIDTRCRDTHAWIEEEADDDPDAIVMATGYCHGTDLIHLDHAIVNLAESNQ